MFYLFTEHHIGPLDYYNKTEGEKAILLAFCLRDMELRKESFTRR